MNLDAIRHIIRGLLIFLAQIVVYKPIGLSSSWLWQNGDVFIYPLIILMLPIRMSRQYVILLGFAIGLFVDLFYDTVGIHAFALTAAAYARGHVLRAFEPRGGYQLSMTPTRRVMGLNWLLSYMAVVVMIHAVAYATIEVFTFVYIGKILIKTVITFILSMIAIVGYHFLFNPRR